MGYMAFHKHSKVNKEFRCYDVYAFTFTLRQIYFRLQAAVFDFSYMLTSDPIVTSEGVLCDPENIEMPFGISLLSCIHSEIHVMSYLLLYTSR